MIKNTNKKCSAGFTPPLKKTFRTYDCFDLRKNRSSSRAGFTIIEALISALIFSLIAILISAIFSRSLQLQRRGNSIQKVQENALFALESMAKEIRVSTFENQDSNCSATSLDIVHPLNGNITYRLTNNVLERVAGSTVNKITGSDVQFSNLKFCIDGSAPNDNKPAKITIVSEMRNTSGKDVVRVNLQTTIISRNISSELEN